MDTSIIPHNPQNPLQFMFEDDPIRIVQDERGEPLFVAADICKALGIVNVSDAMQKIAKDEKGIALVYTDQGNQNLMVVNEPGLYRLIFRSDKPNAKSLQQLVFHEILPSIRKTGGYSIKPTDPLDALEQTVAILRHQQNQIATLQWQQDALETNQQQLDSRVGRLEKRPRKDYSSVSAYLFEHKRNETPERITLLEDYALKLSSELGYEVLKSEGDVIVFHQDILKRLG